MGSSGSKDEFQQHLANLSAPTLASETLEFWANLFACNVSWEEVVQYVTVEQIEKIIKTYPENLELFILQAVHNLNSICYYGFRSELTTAHYTSAITIVRLLSRLLPFISLNPESEASLLWRPLSASLFGVAPITNDHLQIPETRKPQPNVIDQDPAISCLGNEVLHALMRLLFLPGFSVSVQGIHLEQRKPPPYDEVEVRFLWADGIGGPIPGGIPTLSFMIPNRTEVMKCLLACFSKSLYQTVDAYHEHLPEMLQVFASGGSPYSANLLYSLLNTIFTYNPGGYGLPAIFSGDYCSEEYISAALHLLLVLLDFDPLIFNRESEDSQDSTENDFNDQPISPNIFRKMLADFKTPKDVDLVANGCVTLFRAYYDSRKSLLNSASKTVPFSQEMLISLWHMITINGEILRHMCKKYNVDIIVPLLSILQESSVEVYQTKQDETGHLNSRVGPLHICAFILLVLSSERDLAVALNAKFQGKYPLDVPMFEGSHADLFFLVIHSVIMSAINSKISSDSLVDMLLTCLCNISAYIQSFSIESSVRLLNLTMRMTKSQWLFHSAYRYLDAVFLLDTLNNIIQYQYHGNERLIYSILRRKEIFLNLDRLITSGQIPESVYSGADYSGNEKKYFNENDSLDTADSSGVSHIKGGPNSMALADSIYDTLQENGTDGGDGSNGPSWIPTQQWFDEWRQKLPLQTILRLINCLLPMVEEECTRNENMGQEEVLEYIKRVTMVGLLPVPHPIIIRNYQANAYTSLWFTSFMFGVLYSRSCAFNHIPVENVKLIAITTRD